MSQPLNYRGYTGTVNYSPEDKLFHGKLEFIRDLVTYEGTDGVSLEEAFREAVDDYLDLCARQGRAPEKPFKGSFNVRVKPELHRKAALRAQAEETNLNTVVASALEAYLAR